MKRVAICCTLFTAVILFSAAIMHAQIINISHAGASPYGTIQAAIDNAATINGDTITVGSGAYAEYPTVNKTLTLLGSGSPSVNGFTFSVTPVKAIGFNVLDMTVISPGRIQDGVDAISSGGSLGVEAGTYNEHVVINKSMNLVGSTTNPTINGSGTGNCITLAASYIRVKQVILTNAVNGIGGTTSNSQLRFITIHDNTGSGISLASSDDNLIHSNYISNHTGISSCGIELIGCRRNTVTGNDVHGNTYNLRISGAVFRSSGSNNVQGNTFVDPGSWSVQISSGALSSKVNFNAFSTTGTSNHFISNTTSPAELLDGRRNWYQNQDPPGGGSHPTDFFGNVDSSNWMDSAPNTIVAALPQNFDLNSGDPIYVPVMAFIPAGKQVRATQVTLSWNNTFAPLEEGEIPGAFFRNKLVAGQTETFSFTPGSPVNTVTVFDTLNGGSGGAGPSGTIPYIGTLFIMKYRGDVVGIDSLRLTGVDVRDQNFAPISPLVEVTPGTINVGSGSTPGLLVDVKVYLQGAFNGTGQDTTLRHNTLLPLLQPYNAVPWNYAGTENVDPSQGIPAGAVDWMLVELRTGTAANTAFAWRAGWMMTDGAIKGTAGISPIGFPGLDPGNYYVVIRHRNHLAIMSATALPISSASANYDFTTGQGQAFGSNPMVQVGSVFCLIAGNGNGDATVNAVDRNSIWRVQNGNINGYYSGDFNLNGIVNAVDRNTYWRVNNGLLSQVP
jgi:parallel beta-helix repeat protein